MRRPGGPFVVILLVVLVGGAFLPAAMASAPASAEAGPLPPTIQLLSATGEGVVFEVRVPSEKLILEPAKAGNREYVRVSMPGWSATSQAGAPILPQMAQAIGVPFGAALDVQVEPGPAHAMVLAAPALPVATQKVEWDPPTAGEPVATLPQASYAVEEDAAIYAGGVVYPGVLAEVVSDGMVRQQRVAGVVVYPVQYQPTTRELTTYEWLKITVKFVGPASAKSLPPTVSGEPSSPDSAVYEKLLRQELLNYDAARARRAAPSASPPILEGTMRASLPWPPPSPGWRVKVREDGFYKLTYAELQAKGLPVDTLDPRTFRLYNLGREVAVYVTGEEDERFDSGDALLFYGQSVVSKYTRDNVYWLTYGGTVGLRMGSRSGAPGAASTPAYYRARRHLENNGYYVSGAPGDDDLERWMWDYLYPPSRPNWTHTFSLAAPYPGPYTGKLTVAMLGYLQNPINPDHHARLYLNGTLVADVTWDGINWKIVEVSIAQNLLAAGNNTLMVECPNDTGVGYDVVYIGWAELEFANTLRAEGNVSAFNYEASGSWKFQVDGFSSNQLALYDVTNPAAVARIVGISAIPSGSGYAALFQDQVAAPTAYWAMANTAYRTVQAIEADTASNLGSSQNTADYILITHRAFWDQAATLRNYRASQGLRAVRVDLQDIYDEFGYGIVGASAIHDFLAYAYGNWIGPAPSYVLLVGDGHYDPKDYLGYGRASYVPPYLAVVDPWIAETAGDNRYVTLTGADTLPDMMLGRLAVNSSAEASAFINKIVAYEQSPVPGDWQQQVLAVADNADGGGSFAQLSDSLLNCCLPTPYQVQKVYYGVTHPTVAGARAAIQAGINAGKLIVNYVGHGGIGVWADEGLFTLADVSLLQNGGKLPVVLPMTCYEGQYDYPHPSAMGYDAAAEVVTRAEGKGAVASWSPTGLGVATGHEYLDKGFFQALFQDGLHTLGQATNAGKLKLWTAGFSLDLLDTYLLFGDPASSVPLQEAPPTPMPTNYLPLILFEMQ